MSGLSQSNDLLPLMELAPVSTGVGLTPGLTPRPDMDLARTRLGVLYGLFLGLRAKHPPTAIHSLRVAMSCSKWATIRRMSDAERDTLEVAALLHDIGKLGIPEQVLQKTTRLHGEEKAMMDLHAQLGLELLRDANAAAAILDVLATYRQWYDKSPNFEGAAGSFAMMARMIAIVDAFDSMTGGQVFRPSLTTEQAVAELHDKAGSQFDPYLVKEFTALVTQPIPAALEGQLVRRWLTELHSENKPVFEDRAIPFANAALQTMVDSIYHRQLFDSINDAAVYVDSEKRILNWNRSAERMTGQQGSALINQVWTAEIMGLRDEMGRLWESEDCPLDEVELKRRPVIRHLDLFHREGHVFKIKLHVMPVINSNQDYCGAILLAQDASTQVSLEERVQTLYERMTRDPLTGVSNREQLDRRLQEFVPERLESGQPGCLIMCDIDHFKRINDNFGHQAGDEALVSFARILRELSRSSDMVARYGGEEFVVMCRDCDLNTAMVRAQEIRRAVENQPMPSLRGSLMTASFGVTQIQPGDTGESLLARADRALLIAKETGRNRVVQLSAGQAEMIEAAAPPATWFGWFRKRRDNAWIVEREYIIPLPDDVALEKLSGFIHDHNATIVKIEANEATLRLDCYQSVSTRRKVDRPAEMLVLVQWQKVRFAGRHGIEQTKTWLKISVGAMRANDRRLAALMELATHVMRNMVAYMGAEELDEQTRKKIFEVESVLTKSDNTDASAS